MRDLAKEWLFSFKPPPKRTVSEWADENRMLSAESSAEPGRWNTARAEYLREIMDAFSDPEVHTVVFMSSSQVGKTEVILNVLGQIIDEDPAPIMIMQPTQKPMAEAFSKDRLAPMIRDTRSLFGKVKDSKSRDSGNTILHKSFPGGHVTLVGANAPSGLASRPIRVVLCDEVDRYPPSAGTEGDPVNLAFRRTTTFWNRKHELVSTPGLKGASRIEMAYENSDKRKYYIPCPSCGHEQVLTFDRVIWDKDENEDSRGHTHKPETARYYCNECGDGWSNTQRWAAVPRGYWKAHAPFKGVAGFHLNAFYSPWVKLEDVATEWIEALEDTDLMITYINTILGESYEIKGEKADEHELIERREDYSGVPDGVLMLTAGGDVQDDRIEVEVIGWGYKEESWSIDYIVIFGDPEGEEIWEELKAVYSSRYDGHLIHSTMTDTGGHYTQKVYEFCYKHKKRRWHAAKGSNIFSDPVVGKSSMVPIGNKRKTKSGTVGKKVRLHHIGVSQAKNAMIHRLKLTKPGPAYMHFSYNVNDEEYFNMLTAEQLVEKKKAGVRHLEWVKTRARNEALDCRVYGFAAMRLAAPKWEQLAKVPEEKKEPVQKKPRRKGGWKDGWKQ